MTRRRMKMELVNTGKRNQMCCGCGTMGCRWQMYFPSPSVTMLPASATSISRMRFKKIVDGFERAGQVLFVAIQIGEDVALVRGDNRG